MLLRGMWDAWIGYGMDGSPGRVRYRAPMVIIKSITTTCVILIHHTFEIVMKYKFLLEDIKCFQKSGIFSENQFFFCSIITIMLVVGKLQGCETSRCVGQSWPGFVRHWFSQTSSSKSSKSSSWSSTSS